MGVLWDEEDEVQRCQKRNDCENCDEPAKGTRWQEAEKSELPCLKDNLAVRAADSGIKFLQRLRQDEADHTAIRPGSFRREERTALWTALVVHEFCDA